MPPLKVLCLHGFMQNGSVFRARTGSFRKAFKNCEFVFPDAPHPPSEIVFKPAPDAEAEGPAEGDAGNSAALAWYGWHPNRESCVSFTGIEESLRSIAQCERDQGPFDAILAFSMGAVFAQILCAARACHLPPSVQSPSEEVGAYILPSLKFAVFVACRPHKDERFQLGARAVPSFHMQASNVGDVRWLASNWLYRFGNSDTVIPKALSFQVYQAWSAAAAAAAGGASGQASSAITAAAGELTQCFEHDGGHFLPATKQVRDALSAFVARFR